MRKLSNKEMKQVNGGTYRCTYCGFTSDSLFRMALHFGIKSWHNLGHIEEI